MSAQRGRPSSELRVIERFSWAGFGITQFHGSNGRLLSSCLLDIGPGAKLVPDLARAVPSLENGLVSPDGLTIDYPLQPNARWQDGAPLTAADVAYTFAEILNPKNNMGATFPYTEVRSVVAVAPYQLRVHMRHVFAPITSMFFTGSFCVPIVPRHLLAQYRDLNVTPFNEHPIYSGPYRLAEWKRGDRVAFAANQYYSYGKPNIDRVLDVLSTDQSTIISQMKTGELDADFNASALEANELAGLPSLIVRVSPARTFAYLTFNTTDSVLGERRMRRAIALAIDRTSIARDVSYGYFDASNPSQSIWSWAYDKSAQMPRYDARQAENILDTLGWKRTGNAIRTKGNKPLELTLSAANVDVSSRVAVLLQNNLRNVGIGVTIKLYPQSTLLGDAKTGGILYGGRFQMYYGALDLDGLDDDFSENLKCDQRAPAGDNTSRICDRRLDALLADGVLTFDQKRRARIYSHVQHLLDDEIPAVPLWAIPRIDVYTRRLKNYVPSPNSVTFYHPERWRLSGN
jgi:peptide/nickel transport system substrate-binding protein